MSYALSDEEKIQAEALAQRTYERFCRYAIKPENLEDHWGEGAEWEAEPAWLETYRGMVMDYFTAKKILDDEAMGFLVTAPEDYVLFLPEPDRAATKEAVNAAILNACRKVAVNDVREGRESSDRELPVMLAHAMQSLTAPGAAVGL